MRLPRWLMMGLWTLSVLAVVAAAGWWWITWPDRTARSLLLTIADGRFEELEQTYPLLQPLVDTGRFTSENRKHITASFEAPTFCIEDYPTRTFADWVLGRQRFVLSPNAIALREIKVEGNKLVDIKRGFPPNHRRKD